MTGQIVKIANGHESYEIYAADSDFVPQIIKIMQERYGFRPGIPLCGPDEIYVDCVRQRLKITVGWDNWSGAFVMAYNRKGDAFVRELGAYLDTILDELDI